MERLKALHLGCGPIYHESNENFIWINIDKQHHFKLDLCTDINNILTYKSKLQGIKVIFLCHVLEHFNYPNDALQVLKICNELLDTNGIIRIIVPDLLKVATIYVNNDFDKMKDIYTNGKFYYLHDTIGERFNFFLKEWEHKIVYDYIMLRHLLFDAGFRYMSEMEFNKSGIPNWQYDRLQKESIIVEAKK